jgi:hypothetical protein
MKQLVKKLVKKALRLPAKAILASGYDVIQEYIATSPAVWFNPYLSAKVRPYRPGVETYIKLDGTTLPDRLQRVAMGLHCPSRPKNGFCTGARKRAL